MSNILLVILGGTILAPAPDNFDTQFDFLKRQSAQNVGREALVASFEKFISDHPKHPKLAEAMLHVAGLYMLVDPAAKLTQQLDKCVEWSERAAAAAPKGSAVWVTAQQNLVYKIREKNPQRARKILDEIVATVPNDSLAVARVERTWMSMAFDEGRYDDAIAHCSKLLRWYEDSARIPKEGHAKWELDILIVAAGSEIIHWLKYASLPRQEKKQKIESFAYTHQRTLHVTDTAKKVLAELPEDKKPDAPPPAPMVPRRSPLWWFLYMAPVIAIGGGAIYARVRRKKAQT